MQVIRRSLPEPDAEVPAGLERPRHEPPRVADRLLEEAWVSVVPGMDFGNHAPRTHLRLAYTTGMDSLQEAASRIKRWLGR